MKVDEDHMGDFPENDVQIFQTYSSASLIAKSGSAILRHLRAASHPHVGQSIGPGRVKEIAAARKTLLTFLSHPALAAVQIIDREQVLAPGNDGIGVYERIAQGEYAEALIQLDSVTVTVPQALDRDDVDLALLTDSVHFSFLNVQGSGHAPDGANGELVPRRGILPGYDGPPLTPKERRRLVEYSRRYVAGTERNFWLDTLRAESHLGLRTEAHLKSALRLYEGLLADRALDEVRRKFVAIRASATMLRLGDGLFRSKRQLRAEERGQARRTYRGAAVLLDTHGVSADNPLAAEIHSRSSAQRSKLEAGLNFFGYRDSFVPVQRHQALEQRAKQDVALAKSAVGRAMDFRSLANKEEEQNAALRQEETDALTTVEIAAERAATARDQVKRVDLQADILSDHQDWLSGRTLFDVSNAVLQGAAQGAMAALAPETGAGTAAGTGGIGVVAGVGSVLLGKLARSKELELQQEVAQVDRRIAEREVAVAVLEERSAAARLAFISNSIIVNENRLLNQDLFYALARMYEDLGRHYLEVAIREAFLFERAVAYRLQKPEMQLVHFDYESDAATLFAAPDLLERDVESISRELSDDLQKRDEFIDNISLRSTFPLEFAEFSQTGQLNTIVSRYELDKRRPGSSQGRLLDVTLELRGLVPANGVVGTLTHSGRFLLRDRETTLKPETVRLIPTREELDAALAAQENGRVTTAAVGGVAVFDLGPDTKELDGGGPVVEGSQSILLNLTEGYGPAAMWRLKMPPEVARNLTDVVLHLRTEAFESDPDLLEPKVRELIAAYERELEQATGHDLDRFTALSLRKRNPDAYGNLATGTGTFEIPENLVGVTARAKAVLLQALDANGLAVAGVEIAIEKPDGSFGLLRSTGPTGFTEDVSVPLNMIPAEQRPLAAGLWNVRLPNTEQFRHFTDLTLFILHNDRRLIGGP